MLSFLHRPRVVIPLLLLLGSTLLLAVWILADDPRSWVPSSSLPATTAIYDRRGHLLYETLDPERGKANFVPLRGLPHHLLRATVATEDASFYANPGVDPLAILRAAVQNWRSEGVVSGGSTLTQQLARNLWMSPAERSEPSLWRKVREALLAVRLAARLSKDQILELYLNSVPYGHQAVGVDAAARTYFGKGARDLDLAESALLAGLPQAPTVYDPHLDPEMAMARRQVVLSLMVKQGFITEAEAMAAAVEPLNLAPAAFPLKAPHFVAYVRELLAEQYGLDPATTSGLRVYTTLDLGLQEAAEAAVKRHVASLAEKKVSNGALVALDPDNGQILAMVGSADYFDRSIDGEVNVTVSPRQPGSALKPLLYAAAMDRGMTAATVLYDVPTSFLTADGKSYAPENYDRVWHGPVLAREALANSYNLPAVKLLQQLGIGAFLDVVTRAGLSTLATKGASDLSLALGSGEVRLLDLVGAYAALGSGGVAREPAAILRIEDGRGRVLEQASRAGSCQVVSSQAAYLVTDILSDDAARAAAFGRDSVLQLSRPAAVKTGTTTDWRDNWTVGYTPDLAAGVWVGNSDNSEMQGVSGVSGAGPIWHDFMEEALKGRPVARFPEPPGMARREVCSLSGLLPTPSCPNRRVELFAQGTEPSAACDWHRSVLIDRSTGLRATRGTPVDRIEERVYLIVPPELQQWARERGVTELPRGGGSDPTSLPPLPNGEGGRDVELVLTSPAHGAVLQISPELPTYLQKVELVAGLSTTSSATRVEMRVDGEIVGAFDSPPYRATWQLVPGPHVFEVSALDTDGRILASDQAEITVEGGP